MGFFQTLSIGYKSLFRDACDKFEMVAPKALSACGSGLMMIGSAVMAKTALKEDTKDIIDECDRVIAECKESVKNEKTAVKARKVAKFKLKKACKLVKVFRKGIILEAAGAACNTAGIVISEHAKTKALTACAAIGAQFAGYRAAVREDLGAEADAKYMAGEHITKKHKVDPETGEVLYDEVEENDNGEVVLKKDPNAFRFYFSEETCPSLWSPNYDLRKARLDCVERELSIRLVSNGHITLNDMRREFGGLTPNRMDVGIGGIFGRIYNPDDPISNIINLHYIDDKDFIEGRTDSCWIIFDCDPEPIIGRINKKLM